MHLNTPQASNQERVAVEAEKPTLKNKKLIESSSGRPKAIQSSTLNLHFLVV